MSLFDPSQITSQLQTSKGDTCLTCKLFTECKTPKLSPKGNENAEIYIVYGKPSYDDDQGRPAQYSRALTNVLASKGISPSECRSSNCVRCFNAGEDKKYKSIEACRKYLFEDIKKTKPKVIFAVGGDAMRALCGKNYDVKAVPISDIETLQGFVVPHIELNAWVVPVFTSEYVAMKKDKWQTQAEVLWGQDVERGLTYLDKKIEPHLEKTKPKIECITDMKRVEWVLHRWTIEKPKLIAFDYEATGLKPYRDGHEILCVSMCDGICSYAFPFPLSEAAEKTYKQLLTDPEIGKIAHNAKFEWMWTKEKLGISVLNMKYDPCLMSHMLCNKRGVTGLKFQTFVNFGVGDYAKPTKGFIEGKAEKVKWNEGPKWKTYKHANCFNDLGKFPIMSNLEYCAKDSWYTYKLAQIQVKQMKDTDMISPTASKVDYGYDLYMKGSLALAEIERNGIAVDVEYLEKTMTDIDKEVKEVKATLLKEPLIKEWEAWITRQKKKFNLDSGAQLGKFLYEYKGIKCNDFTDKGGYSTEAEALHKLCMPELDSLIHYKKLHKILNTFLKGFYFERNGNIIHPFFSLNIAISGRSSSQSPNFQNNSKHDGIYSAYVRKAIVPHKGQHLAELDYKSLEVLCGLYYHGDSTMHNYLLDPSSDQHADTAAHLFLNIDKSKENPLDLFNRLTGGKKNKDSGDIFRQLAKTFNFATFFGSNHHKTAPSTWSEVRNLKLVDGTPYKEYLKNNGITTLKQWDKHVESIDDNFWNVRFKEYGAWRTANYKKYQKVGYFDNKMGFRYKGVMAKTKTSNLGIQGSAFNILLFSLTHLQNWLRDTGKKTKIVGQIHDSILMSIEPSEMQEVISKAKEIMEQKTDEFYDWITIPLQVDVDLGTKDGDWTTLKPTPYAEIMEKDWQ